MKSTILCTAILVLMCVAAQANAQFVAFNDCVHAGGIGYATNYSAYMADGGGFETPSGFLRNWETGAYTSVTVAMNGYNISGSTSAAPAPGTDAYNTFDGKVSLGDWSTSYNSSSSGWFYEATFTGLDPMKTYEFVTTGNRNSSSYAGDGPSSRWTKFSIIGADAYTNASTAGVVEISPDVVRFNTGYNTLNGYVARWTGITAADGSFTVRSENVGAAGPGEANKSYGMEGFMLREGGETPEIPEPTSLILVGAAVGLLALLQRRR